jgi:hypothetical protein
MKSAAHKDVFAALPYSALGQLSRIAMEALFPGDLRRRAVLDASSDGAGGAYRRACRRIAEWFTGDDRKNYRSSARRRRSASLPTEAGRR